MAFSTDVQQNLVDYYTSLFRTQEYYLDIRESNLLATDTQSGYCQMTSFALDMYALFSIFNVIPAFGTTSKVIFIPAVTLYYAPIGGVATAQNIFEIITEGDLKQFYGIMARKWRLAILTGPCVLGLEGSRGIDFLFGIFVGNTNSNSAPSGTLNDEGHAMAYILDIQAKTYEIFDVNGQNLHSSMAQLRSFFIATCLQNAGYRAATFNGAPNIIGTPGMVNQHPIDHPGACGLWAIMFLWLRLVSTGAEVAQLFDNLKNDNLMRAHMNIFTQGIFKCIQDIFQDCMNIKFKQHDRHIEQVMSYEYDGLMNQGTKNFRLRKWERPVTNMMQAIFGCSMSYNARITLRSCSPSAVTLEPFFATAGVRFPWKYVNRDETISEWRERLKAEKEDQKVDEAARFTRALDRVTVNMNKRNQAALAAEEAIATAEVDVMMARARVMARARARAMGEG